MATSIGIIKKFVQALIETNKTSIDAADEAFKAVGAGSYSNFQSIFRSAQTGYSDQDFCEQVCGIRINNKDTGAITGSDAGGKTVKTAENIMPETAAAVELTDEEYNSFTKNGLTVNITYVTKSDSQVGSNFNNSSETYLAKQKLVVRALYNWWLPEALDLINQSLGINFTDGRANINELNIEFTYTGSSAISLNFAYDMGLASETTLTINPNLLYNITESDLNGTLPKNNRIYSYDFYGTNSAEFTNYLDRLFLQAMAEITMKANIPYVAKLPSSVRQGLAAIVGGYDDASTNYYYFASSSYNGYGYSLMRYLAKIYADGEPDNMPEGLRYNDAKTILTALDSFTGETINLADFATSVKTVDASALTNGVNIIGNDSANSIPGGSGADTLWGGVGNDTLTGGNGNDLFIYSGGNDVITDYTTGTDKISLGADISQRTISGADVLFMTDNGTLTVKDGKNKGITCFNSTGQQYSITLTSFEGVNLTDDNTSKVTLDSGLTFANASKRTKAVRITGNASANSITGGSGKDSLYGGKGNDTILGNKGKDLIKGEAGSDYLRGGDGKDTLCGGDNNDTLLGDKGNDKLLGESGNDYLNGGDGDDTISGGDGNDKLLGGAGDDSLSGGAGKDSLVGGTGDDTLLGGTGNDTLTGGKGADVFVYGGGNDLITDYNADDGDIIQIANGKVTTVKQSGKNIIFTLNTGKITVKGGKGQIVTYTDKDENIFTFPQTVNFNSAKTGATILSNYTRDSFDIADYDDYKNSVKTIDGSAAPLDISITGNKLMNKIIGGSGNDTLIGGKSNDTLTGGDGSDVFIWNKGDGTDVITDYTSEDKIKIASGAVTDISVSGNDAIFQLDGGKIIVKKAKDKVITYIDADGISRTYPEIVSIKGSKITLLDTYMNDDFNVGDYASTLKTIDASAVTHALNITGNKLANRITGSSQDDSIDGGAAADTILGGAGNDTILGGKGNDNLKGGNGADIFVYATGDGNDIITDYSEEDKIRITKGTVKASTSGKNVILNVGTGKISLKGAADKIVTYINKSGSEICYSNTVAVKGKIATLSDKYSRDAFVAGDYGSAIRKIDASKVSTDLSITGSAFADSILGGAGNDSIYGGRGNDTLKGGNGKDVFVYNSGDGNDTITDYSPGDTIKIASGSLADKVEVNGKDVTFTVNNSGTITAKNGKNKKITFVDKDGNTIRNQVYTKSTMQTESLWFIEDDTNFATADNQLGSIVKDSASAYSFDTSTDLKNFIEENTLIAYTDKK